ncbi:hypothetical protein HK102_012860 [Quaeritorhiza haematococci]|nr:hypothetical protein HK102_012860 [Quaeritorhiza haematococci]
MASNTRNSIAGQSPLATAGGGTSVSRRGSTMRRESHAPRPPPRASVSHPRASISHGSRASASQESAQNPRDLQSLASDPSPPPTTAARAPIVSWGIRYHPRFNLQKEDVVYAGGELPPAAPPDVDALHIAAENTKDHEKADGNAPPKVNVSERVPRIYPHFAYSDLIREDQEHNPSKQTEQDLFGFGLGVGDDLETPRVMQMKTFERLLERLTNSHHQHHAVDEILNGVSEADLGHNGFHDSDGTDGHMQSDSAHVDPEVKKRHLSHFYAWCPQIVAPNHPRQQNDIQSHGDGFIRAGASAHLHNIHQVQSQQVGVDGKTPSTPPDRKVLLQTLLLLRQSGNDPAVMESLSLLLASYVKGEPERALLLTEGGAFIKLVDYACTDSNSGGNSASLTHVSRPESQRRTSFSFGKAGGGGHQKGSSGKMAARRAVLMFFACYASAAVVGVEEEKPGTWFSYVDEAEELREDARKADAKVEGVNEFESVKEEDEHANLGGGRDQDLEKPMQAAAESNPTNQQKTDRELKPTNKTAGDGTSVPTPKKPPETPQQRRQKIQIQLQNQLCTGTVGRRILKTCAQVIVTALEKKLAAPTPLHPFPIADTESILMIPAVLILRTISFVPGLRPHLVEAGVVEPVVLLLNRLSVPEPPVTGGEAGASGEALEKAPSLSPSLPQFSDWDQIVLRQSLLVIIRNLAAHSPEVKDDLVKMGVIEQLASMIAAGSLTKLPGDREAWPAGYIFDTEKLQAIIAFAHVITPGISGPDPASVSTRRKSKVDIDDVSIATQTAVWEKPMSNLLKMLSGIAGKKDHPHPHKGGVKKSKSAANISASSAHPSTAASGKEPDVKTQYVVLFALSHMMVKLGKPGRVKFFQMGGVDVVVQVIKHSLAAFWGDATTEHLNIRKESAGSSQPPVANTPTTSSSPVGPENPVGPPKSIPHVQDWREEKVVEFGLVCMRNVALMDIPVKIREHIAHQMMPILRKILDNPDSKPKWVYHSLCCICNLAMADKCAQQQILAYITEEGMSSVDGVDQSHGGAGALVASTATAATPATPGTSTAPLATLPSTSNTLITTIMSASTSARMSLLAAMYRMLFKSTNPDLFKPLLKCLGNLCIDEDACLAIVSMGQPKLLELLFNSKYRTNLQAMVVIRNLIVANRYSFVEFSRVDGFIEELVANMSAKNPMLRKCSVEIVMWFLEKGGDAVKQALLEADTLSALVVPMEEESGTAGTDDSFMTPLSSSATSLSRNLSCAAMARHCFQLLQTYERTVRQNLDPWTRISIKWKLIDEKEGRVPEKKKKGSQKGRRRITKKKADSSESRADLELGRGVRGRITPRAASAKSVSFDLGKSKTGTKRKNDG